VPNVGPKSTEVVYPYISARVVSAVGQKMKMDAVGFEAGSHSVRNGDLNV